MTFSGNPGRSGLVGQRPGCQIVVRGLGWLGYCFKQVMTKAHKPRFAYHILWDLWPLRFISAHDGGT